MNDESELPAVYRTLSMEGLERLRTSYVSRRDESRGWLREFYARRLGFVEVEIRRRAEEQE